MGCARRRVSPVKACPLVSFVDCKREWGSYLVGVSEVCMKRRAASYMSTVWFSKKLNSCGLLLLPSLPALLRFLTANEPPQGPLATLMLFFVPSLIATD